MCAHPDVDAVLVLTSMPEHGRLARAALEAGKHVLVEKPVATTLEEAARCSRWPRRAPGHLLCAPHILLSPTYRAMHAHVGEGSVGGLLTARARYGWAGPDWSRWFYEPGGGALFDLGVYNVTSLCGFFGPARRVTAMTGVAIPERVIDGEPIRVQAEDNAHVLIDFGDARFAVVTTGFTMQQYRSPCIELYGTHGVLQMLGDDWAPEGYELWRNDRSVWEVHPETDPAWPWTDGLRHLVECIETGEEPVTRPEHAYHALEIMLAAQAAGADGRAREIASGFPAPDLERLGAVAAAGRSGCTTRGARREPRRAARPAEVLAAADVRRPGADPARRRHPPHLGRPGGGRGVRLDLRVDGAGPHARLRAAARRRVPALGGVPHDLRRGRAAPRAGGRARDRGPGDGRGAARGRGESVFFRRDTWHHAFALGPEPLRVLELFAPPPAAGASSAYARAQPYLETSRYADDELLGSWPPPAPRDAAAAGRARRPTSCTAATSACSAGCS